MLISGGSKVIFRTKSHKKTKQGLNERLDVESNFNKEIEMKNRYLTTYYTYFGQKNFALPRLLTLSWEGGGILCALAGGWCKITLNRKIKGTNYLL